MPEVRPASSEPAQVGDGSPSSRATAYDALFRHVLARTDAERAHRAGFAALRAAGPAAAPVVRRLLGGARPVHALGLSFAGPLGLAAGFDKNAEGIDALAAWGFSHVEVGTVTAEPQPGNPRPRLFRLPADGAVVNRMGFNNDGAVAVAGRLAARRRAQRRRAGGPVLGVNIGKTKVVPDDEAEADYAKSARLLAPYADYLVVNVSSPNTPGLRDLQAVTRLRPLLTAVRDAADATTDHRLPLLVKIAPDLSDADVLAVADLALELGLDGIVATNTTTRRDSLRSDPAVVADVGPGGLSGSPLAARAEQVLRLLRHRAGPDLTLVGVGGISTPAQARARLAAGATLLQAYTGFVYGGPAWPARMQRALAVPGPPRVGDAGGEAVQ